MSHAIFRQPADKANGGRLHKGRSPWSHGQGPTPSEHPLGNNKSIPFINSVSSVYLVFILILFLLLMGDHINQTPITTEASRIGGQSNEVECEIIQPILLDESIHDHGTDLVLQSCPKELHILIRTSFGDDLMIHLVKNQHLIHDTYFKIRNKPSDSSITKSISSNKPNELTTHEEPTNSAHISKTSSSTPPTPKGDTDFERTHQFLTLHNFTSNDDHCHYQGFTGNNNFTSISAISIVNSRLLSGFLSDGNSSFYLIADVASSSTIITKPTAKAAIENDWSDCKRYSDRIRNRRSPSPVSRRRFSMSNPDNKVIHEPFQANSSSLFVELLVVHDHSQYVDNNSNATLIAERTMQIVNIMNAFYRQLNIFVALVGVVLWTEKDEIELTDDGDVTLTNFLKYRYEKLLPKYHHDNAQLITSTSFNGSVVGKALKGPICTHDHSGGVNTDHSHNPAITAVTLAHELGHNLGMEHDEDAKCKCSDEKCIMSSSSSLVHPKQWSSCSVEYLEESRKHGVLDCLVNEPVQIFGPVCGNGFVEEGEDCDLGEPIPSYGTSKSRSNKNSVRSSDGTIQDPNLLLRNPCCDRMTCKFTTNSTCAQGPCCDLTRCSVFNANNAKVCRPRKTECDIEEFCDGSDEYCPRDVYYHDGIECGPGVGLAPHSMSPDMDSMIYNRIRAFCYKGHCSSHESQCQLLWGPSGSTSRDICYEQNVHGNTSGNCGFHRNDKSFESCEMDNAACGMLHCVHNQVSVSDSNRKTGKLNYGFDSASILTVSFFVMSNHAKIYCHSAIIDAGPTMRDPGLAPNGAACGEDRMCLNQKCVSIHDVMHQDWCPYDCNGNGICDNTGVCHCNDGTTGTSCYQFFSANFNLSLVLYMIMFFGPIIALIVLATSHYKSKIKMWWYLHNRMVVLRNKAREPNRHKRSAYVANGRKVSISEPIPLNTQNSINGNGALTSANNLDPWAETSYQIDLSGKTPGYRLEPLRKAPPPPVPDYPSEQWLPQPPPHYPKSSGASTTKSNQNSK